MRGMRTREATSPPRSGYPFSRLFKHEGGAHMPDDRCRLGSDVVIGLDLASAEQQAVVLTAAGQRLTRFRIPHTRAGLELGKWSADYCRRRRAPFVLAASGEGAPFEAPTHAGLPHLPPGCHSRCDSAVASASGAFRV